MGYREPTKKMRKRGCKGKHFPAGSKKKRTTPAKLGKNCFGQHLKKNAVDETDKNENADSNI